MSVDEAARRVALLPDQPIPSGVRILINGLLRGQIAVALAEPAIVGGPNGVLISNVIADQLTVTDNPYFGSALSVVLLLAVLVILAVVQLVRQVSVRTRARTVTP